MIRGWVGSCVTREKALFFFGKEESANAETVDTCYD